MSETNCLLGSSIGRDEASKMTRVEYWYGIETATEYSPSMTYELERQITGVAQSSLSWCYQHGGRRMQDASGDAYFLDENGRRLSIMAMNSGPLDQPYQGGRIDSCPQEKLNPSDECYVIKGQMSLVSHASDDLSISIHSIRVGIKEAMDNDELLDPTIPKLSDVTRVVYLGDSEESVLMYGLVDGGDSMGAGGNNGDSMGSGGGNGDSTGSGNNGDSMGSGGGSGDSMGSGGSNGDSMGSDGSNGDSMGVDGDSKGIDSGTSGGDDRSGIFVPVVTTAVIGTALLALLLLLLRRRRKIMTQRQLDFGAAVAAASSDVSSNNSFSMSDPEGAFHQGYYHYKKDGVRYLSQFCTTCRETERQLAMGQGLETISEDEQYFKGRNRLVEADSKDLGGFHSTMDFHTCTSATCPCRDRERDVTFIPWLSTKAQSSDVTESTNVVSNTRSSKRERSMEV